MQCSHFTFATILSLLNCFSSVNVSFVEMLSYCYYYYYYYSFFRHVFLSSLIYRYILWTIYHITGALFNGELISVSSTDFPFPFPKLYSFTSPSANSLSISFFLSFNCGYVIFQSLFYDKCQCPTFTHRHTHTHRAMSIQPVHRHSCTCVISDLICLSAINEVICRAASCRVPFVFSLLSSLSFFSAA